MHSEIARLPGSTPVPPGVISAKASGFGALIILLLVIEWQVQKWITSIGSAGADGNNTMPLLMQAGVAVLSTLTCIWAVHFYQKGRKVAGIALYVLMTLYMLQMGLWEASQPRFDSFWSSIIPANPLSDSGGHDWIYWTGLIVWIAISAIIFSLPSLSLGMMKEVVLDCARALPYSLARARTARRAEVVHARMEQALFLAEDSAHRDHIANVIALKMAQKAALEEKRNQPKGLTLGKVASFGVAVVLMAGLAHAQMPEPGMAGKVGIWLDDSGGAPATDQAYANAIAPILSAAVRNAPLGALVTVTSFGDSKASPKLMWHSRIQAKTTPDGMERAALARTVDQLIRSFPAFIAKKGAEQESHIIGALYNAAQTMPEGGKYDLWVVSDLWEHTAAYDLSCIPGQKAICGLPKSPGFSLKGATIHVLGAGKGEDSQRVMGMIELWKVFIAKTGARADIKATGF